MNFKDVLGKKILFFDGAMGTMLQDKGLSTTEMPEQWNFTHAQAVLDIHKGYLAAGCHIIKTNTFGANKYKLAQASYGVKETIEQGVNIAKRAIKETNKEAYVALDIGALGKLMQPLGELSFDEAYKAFKEMVCAGVTAGAELILIETMSDTYETKAAVLAAKENSDLPVIVTMIFDEEGRLLTGGDIAAAVAMLEGLRVDALGFNCGFGPQQMLNILPDLVACTSLPIVINPNAGLPAVVNGKTIFAATPAEFAQAALQLAKGGAMVLGGCCGTTPEHLKQTIELCLGEVTPKQVKKDLTVVSSYGRAVCFKEKPLIIGERINPTGKPMLKQALREDDMTYIFKEALAQQEGGAHILDVNVGLPEINETKMLEKVILGLQGITDLPLQIDTSSARAMERAMRIYNGKPLINSVNGKKESMEEIFPLVQKYGGVVICLTLDENGIPETAAERIKIAEKIIKKADEYGIEKKDLIFDTLTMTISTGSQNGLVTLKAMQHVKNVLRAHTVLGVSNISFGLPQRENVNAAFFAMALADGLSAGIINPLSKQMMQVYDSFCVLAAHDEQCRNYIAKYSVQDASAAGVGQNAPGQPSPTQEDRLFNAVVKGLAQNAAQATEKLLQTKDALAIVDEDIISALDYIGKGFEAKTIFLPQLLMSAEAAKAAFEKIKTALSKKGSKREAKGTIVLATVKGDVHDIGKNIVKVLLENYGFNVIDLGKDVDPHLVAETVLANNIAVVGLSALMTTTVVSMEETIKLLKKVAPGCRVMVGGAVLTQKYADMIGADFYSKDAMGAVRYAESLFTK